VVDTVAKRWPNNARQPVEVVVPDCLAALQRFAVGLRGRYADLRVVSVTGSVGKTTVKEAVAAVLAVRHNTLKSAGNYNNEIGLPLTLTCLGPEHRYAVLEMGMYALGEIAALCAMARPQVGVVTNVRPVHLERLGTIERIARAKAELVTSLPADGVAVLNGDDSRVAAMADLTEARVVTWGQGKDNMVTAQRVVGLGLDGVSFVARVRSAGDLIESRTEHPIQLRMLGQHAVMAALPAIAVGLVEGLSWEEMARGLWEQGHGLRLLPKAGIRGTMILDDCYNASPSSTCAALDLASTLPGRHVAVLGDMLELGTAEASGHLLVGEHCAHTADLVIAVGERAKGIAEGALAAGLSMECIHSVGDNEDAISILQETLAEGDTILIKGSRGMAMERIVNALEVHDA